MGNCFPKVLSVLLSYFSEYFQVFHNVDISKRVWVFGNVNIAKSGKYVDHATLVFVSWPEITLLRMMCGKQHCYDAKAIYPTKDLVFISDYAAVNVKVVLIKC